MTGQIEPHRSRSASNASRRRDRSALASREKCPCFQFARLLRCSPSGVRGPVLLPPRNLHGPFGMAAPRRGFLSAWTEHRSGGAAFALARASRRARIALNRFALAPKRFDSFTGVNLTSSVLRGCNMASVGSTSGERKLDPAFPSARVNS
jgi:hypothetical protein